MIEIIFLGTSSMFPTKERNHPSIYLRYEGERMLFDCGEGTQRQMRICDISPTKIKRIFISHWHGDHSLGLGGIIQSLSASKRKEKLEIYGPAKTKRRVKSIMESFSFYKNFEVVVYEIEAKRLRRILETENFEIYAFPLKHIIPCLGYIFKEKDRRRINLEYTKKFGLVQHPIMKRLQKGEDIEWRGNLIRAKDATYIVPGKKIVYISDTKFFKGLVSICENADLIISESCYCETEGVLADEYYHLTAAKIATVAKEANAKQLILFHFSQRYKEVDKILKEAIEIFPNTKAAYDFMRVILK